MSSRLFQNIREKQGLCYYISARNYSSQNHGQIIIRAGIDKARFDFGIEKIYEELDAIANGSMTQQDFENAIGYTE
jgi:predicted Zn-dependent peptidase